MPKFNGDKYLQIAIFCLALLVSVGFNVFFMGVDNQQEQDSDASMYSMQAKNIHQYIFKTPDARYPLFPIFLSFLYFIFDDCLLGIRLVMSILTAINCVFTYRVAKHVTNSSIAILAGLIAAIYPNLFFWGAFLLTETLFTTFFLAAIYLIIRLSENPPSGQLFFTGVLLGLASLTRGMLLLFLPLLLLWLTYIYWKNKKILAKVVFCIFAAAALVVLPWTIRNYVILGKLIPIAANGGRSLYGGNNPLSLQKEFKGLGLWDDKAMEKLLPETEQMSLVERDKYCYGKAMQWIGNTLKNKPAEFFELEFWKLQKAYFPKVLGRDSNAKRGFYFFYVCVTALGIAGIVLSLPDRKKCSLFYLILFTHLLTVLIFFGEVRLRAPFDPILIIFSAISVATFCTRVGLAPQELLCQQYSRPESNI